MNNEAKQQLKRLLEAGSITQAQHEAMLAALAPKKPVPAGSAKARGKKAQAAAKGAVIARNVRGSINTGRQSTTIKKQVINQAPADKTKPTRKSLREAYLNCVFEACNDVPLAGVDPKAASQVNKGMDLSAIYTALYTDTPADVVVEPTEKNRYIAFPRRFTALTQLDIHSKLVLLGDPGGGKTTFLRFVALCLAGEGLGNAAINLKLLRQAPPQEDDAEEKAKPKPQKWEHGPLLPIVVVLRDFAARGLPAPGQTATAHDLWQFIEREVIPPAIKDFAPLLRKELLSDEPRCLLLLDGLDEVPEAEQRRAQIKQAVEDFVATFKHCRVLVTSRTYAYQSQDWQLKGFESAKLTPFTPAQIRLFVERWYAHVGQLRKLPEQEASGRAELLKSRIFGNPRLRELAERPLLLTQMASLHAWHGGDLPEKREALYAQTVDLLLDRWESPKTVLDKTGHVVMQQPSLAQWLRVDRQKVRDLLNELAFKAHAAQPADQQGTADIDERDLVSGLMRISNNPEVNPALLVRYLSDRAGLLLPHGVGVFTFPHRTLQEYLAACYLTDHDYPDEVARLAKQDANRWREAALLAGAKAATGTLAALWVLVETLADKEVPHGPAEEADQWGALLAGQALVECVDVRAIPAIHQPKAKRVRDWQLAVMRQHTLPAVERALAGRTLAQLGDPRREVTMLEEMQFCWVPRGEFWMGENKEEHTLNLDYDYWMARFLVTVAQFKQFVEQSGYAEHHPLALQGRENDPVVVVSWHDAQAFCQWLTDLGRKQGWLREPWSVQLATEAEWEKAARGGLQIPQQPMIESIQSLHSSLNTPALRLNPHPKARFPWGEQGNEDWSNISGTRIGETSAVGCFSAGVSPYGCEDMSGNVLEWTHSIYKDYPYDPNDGRERTDSDDRRVLRGGAFSSDQWYARCAYRYLNLPDYRNNLVGFRIVVSPFFFV